MELQLEVAQLHATALAMLILHKPYSNQDVLVNHLAQSPQKMVSSAIHVWEPSKD
jgi:hypothetical protein